MEIVTNTPEKIAIRMSANETLANAIRRSITEIPILGIDEVEMHKNDSALYDEMLAHRIGLVPIKNEGSINDKMEVELKLSKTGPCTVFAGDIKGGVAPVYPQTPLVLLEKDQELEFVATARVGKGIAHEKYTPGLCFYRHLTIVNSKNARVQTLVETSRGVIKPEKVKEGWLCDINESVADEITKVDPESLHDADEIILLVESFGQMTAKEILLKAIRALGENVEAFEKSFS